MVLVGGVCELVGQRGGRACARGEAGREQGAGCACRGVAAGGSGGFTGSGLRIEELNKASGFSLVELMMVITMSGVLAVVALYSFTNLRTNASVGGEVKDFMGQMEYARAEALREGSTVTVCASTTGTTCTGGTTWNTGYIVFSDINGNGALDGSDVLLRRQNAFKSTDTLTSSNSISFFTFNRLGFVNNVPANTTVLMTGHASVPAPSSTQCVAVSLVGQLTAYTYGNGGCS